MAAELLTLPAARLAELVRSGEVRARELAEAALARIEALDGEVNAFTLVDAEGALAAAEAIEPGDPRPFCGVPTAIKDLSAAQGLRLSMGSDLFGDHVPAFDDFAVRRLRDAGFVFVGKTNAPEFGILPVTAPRRFGPTRNPWDLGRTPGGSSGGAGAAVAAGMLPVAHGSDGGGSVRIPAACCGLVGLKPQRGRISRGPAMGDSYLVTDGMLTRTVADTAALLDVLAGYEPGDATWAAPPAEPFARSAEREPGRLRVGLVLRPALAGAEVHPECVRAARAAGDLLESLGHGVEEADPPFPGDLLHVFSAVWATNVAAGVRYGAMVAGRDAARDDVEPLTWELYSRGRALDAPSYQMAVTGLQRIGRRLVTWALDYDVLLTPALAQRPAPVGEIDACGADPMAEFAKSGAFTPFTAVWNVTGQPAVSLPLFQGEDGLPSGVQIVGPPLGEGLLLSLAAQLEAAAPWAERRPPAAVA